MLKSLHLCESHRWRVRQITDIFGMHLHEIAKYTGHLLHEQCIQALQREGEIYYEVSSAGSPASTELENNSL